MVPFDVEIGNRRVPISWESLIWFFIVTSAATVVGELVYNKWVQPYLTSLPNLPTSMLPAAIAAPAATAATAGLSGIGRWRPPRRIGR